MCTLPPITERRFYQSQVGTLVCGGSWDTNVSNTCEEFNLGKQNCNFPFCESVVYHSYKPFDLIGQWGPSYDLLENRFCSPVWPRKDGIMLLGGYYSDTTELLHNGESTYKFNLTNRARFCDSFTAFPAEYGGK